ncbi:stearoyl-CoA desaturase 5-like [Branchiostoma floridae x Branchiostoma japonicum]
MATRCIDDTAGPLAGAVASDPAEIPLQSSDVRKDKRPWEIAWHHIVKIGLIHLGAIYGLFLLPSARAYTLLWAFFCYAVANCGVTAGAHRLWSHRSYKARLPLRVFLALAHSMAFQYDLYKWCQDHRNHHKYLDTDADPHNSKRGFFFTHVGWLLLRKHPDVKAKGKLLDMSDMKADPVVRIQRKFYLPSALLMCFVIPTLVPLLWDESLSNAFYICGFLRLAVGLHSIWAVNSFAHMWGTKPYDKHVTATENPLVAFFIGGEGWHNYHHAFPVDYSSSEFGWKANAAMAFIDIMAWLGLAYDLKKASPGVVRARAARTGDRSWKEGAQ